MPDTQFKPSFALILAAAGIISAAVYYWVLTSPSGVCIPGTVGDHHEKTVAALDATVDLGLKLSTSLVGLGAAALIGLKTGFRLTAATRLFLFMAILFFAQSALCGIWWRLEIANGWLNQCLNIVVHPRLQSRYQAHFSFFLLGLFTLGALVAVSAMRWPDKPLTGDLDVT